MDIFSYLYQQHGQPGLYPASPLACSLDDAPYSRLACSLDERNLINLESWALLYGAMPGDASTFISHPTCLYNAAFFSQLDEEETIAAIELYESRLQAERDRIIARCREISLLEMSRISDLLAFSGMSDFSELQ
jgi:hypothetical protein